MNYINFEERPWGRFYVLHDQPTYKLKRIEVDPEKDFHTNTIILKDLSLGQSLMG